MQSMAADAQMLQLLQRAAQELKSVQQQLDAERVAHAATQESLRAMKAAQVEFEISSTVERPAPDTEDRTTVTAASPEILLQRRIETLESELAQARAQPLHSGEEDAAEPEVTPPPQPVPVEGEDGRKTLEQRAATAEARVGELALSLKALKGDHYALKQKHEALTAESARLTEMLEAAQTASHAAAQETEAVRLAYSELEAELAHAESQRTTAALAAESFEQAQEGAALAHQEDLNALAASHSQALAAIQSELADEHEKHQTLAQKHLDTRARVRELETAYSLEQTRRADLETSLESERAQLNAQLLEAQQSAVTQAELLAQRHAAQVAELTAQLAEMTAQAEHARNEFRHADTQYAQLHREMLALLDQRDEALRLRDQALAEVDAVQADIVVDEG